MEKTQGYPNSFSQGLNKDTNPLDAPEGTITFALNAIRDSSEGGKQSYQSEPGNELCFSVPSGYQIIHSIYTEGNQQIVFSTNGTSSELGFVDNCVYKTLINDPCLGFKREYRITGAEYRVKNGCDRIVYFSDGHNPDKAINIDKLDLYKDPDGSWNCNLMRLNPVFKMPCIEDFEVLDGGNEIELGVYSFVIELLDSRFNVLYRSVAQGNVPITDVSGEGGYNIEYFDPSQGGVPKVFKSIKLDITNLDTQANYFRVAVIKYTNGDEATRSAYVKSETIPIESNEATYVVSGFNPAAGDTTIDVGSLLVPNIIYETSEAMEQVQNRLVRVNLKSPTQDVSGYQRYASKIKTNYVIKEVPLSEYFNNPKNYANMMNFMGDEVYANGIMYLTDKGELVGPFHIPGPPLNADCDGFVPDNVLEVKNRCIDVKINIVPDYSGGTILTDETFRVRIRYTLNGVLVTQTTDPLEINNDEVINQSVHYLCFTEAEWAEINNQFDVSIIDLTDESLRPRISVTTTPIIRNIANPDPSTIPYYGWDDSPFRNWRDDLNPFFSSEEMFNELFAKLEDEYNDTLPPGSPRVRLLGATDPAALDFLKSRKEVPKWWQVYNTAFKYDNGNKGRPGYYECTNSVYPDIRDCEGNDIWGVDCAGEPLVGKPVRHPKMPDRTLEPVFDYDNEIVRLIGLEFENIEYPDSSIVGHYFLRGERNEGDKTIVDKGFMGVTSITDNDAATFRDFANYDSANVNTVHYFFSPRGVTRGSLLNGTHFKIEQRHTANCISRSSKGYRVSARITLVRQSIEIASVLSEITNQEPHNQVNYSIVGSRIVSPDGYSNSSTKFPIRTINYSVDTKVPFYNLDRPIGRNSNNPLEVYYAGLKVNRDVYCDLFSINYTLSHNCALSEDDKVSIFGGDTFINNFTVSALSNIVTGQNFSSTYPMLTGNTQCQSSSIDIVSLIRGANDTNDISIFGGGTLFLSADASFIGHAINKLFVESEVNYALRHKGTNDSDFYVENTDLERLFRDQLIRPYKDEQASDPDEASRWQYQDPIKQQVFRYNPDYSVTNRPQLFRSLPSNFDYCNKCINDYKNRVAWSEVSFDEDVADFYKIFLVNNYKDLPAHRGEITGLKYKDNKLLVHTLQTTFVLMPNPQEIKTDASSLYIGTGSFLGLPPIELVQSDAGYAGSQSFTGYCNSEMGYIWADSKRGSIFSFTDKIQELSLLGLQQWFKEHLPMIITDQFPELENRSLGLFMAYDPRYKRLIITKKDYELKPKYVDSAKLVDNRILVGGQYYSFSNKDIFYNRSWTLSYSFEYNSWVSWHSYMPDLLYNTDTHFYSVLAGSSFKHRHDRLYQVYYDLKYDFIVESVYKDLVTKDLHTVNYIGETKRYDVLQDQWYDASNITFNKMLAYNQDQSTGLVNLELITSPYQNLRSNNNTKYISKSSRHYNISALYDIANRLPVVTSNPEILSLYPGYIDILDNPAAIDRNTSAYKARYLTGKWVLVRLFFSPEEDAKKIIYLVSTKEHKSVR